MIHFVNPFIALSTQVSAFGFVVVAVFFSSYCYPFYQFACLSAYALIIVFFFPCFQYIEQCNLLHIIKCKMCIFFASFRNDRNICIKFNVNWIYWEGISNALKLEFRWGEVQWSELKEMHVIKQKVTNRHEIPIPTILSTSFTLI